MCSLCDSDASVDPKHLLQHHERVLIDLEGESIYVRRSFLRKDAVKQTSKDSLKSRLRLREVFISEQSMDEGGQRRDFFHLLLREIFSQSGLFAGYPTNVLPLHNVEAVEK